METMESIDALVRLTREPLTKEQIAMCMHLCYCNANDLYDDAKILLRHKKLARAFGLCVLSLEELAKVPLLLNCVFLKANDKVQWKKFWKAFNSHKLKQNTWLIYGQRSFIGEDRTDLYKHLYPRNFPSIDKMKQLSFYVDTLNFTPMKPEILFEHLKGLVGLAMKMVGDRIKAFSALHSTPQKSRKAVEFASRITISGMSEEEFVKSIFDSIDALSNS